MHFHVRPLGEAERRRLEFDPNPLARARRGNTAWRPFKEFVHFSALILWVALEALLLPALNQVHLPQAMLGPAMVPLPGWWILLHTYA